MRLFVGGRASGKTHQLIKYASNNDLLIVCRDPIHIINQADDMFIILKHIPMSYGEYHRKLYARGNYTNSVKTVIDDIEAFLKYEDPNLVGFTFDNGAYVERERIVFDKTKESIQVLESHNVICG